MVQLPINTCEVMAYDSDDQPVIAFEGADCARHFLRWLLFRYPSPASKTAFIDTDKGYAVLAVYPTDAVARSGKPYTYSVAVRFSQK